MKLEFVVITTLCLLWSQVQSNNDSTGEFSSLLETVVGNAVAVTPPFRIHAQDGKCAQAKNNDYMFLRACGTNDQAERFTFHDDGTLRVGGQCLTLNTANHYRNIRTGDCNNANKDLITWRVRLSDRQIYHPSTGFVLSVTWTTSGDNYFTLQPNLYSTLETFRLDYNAPVPSARIEGMNGLCLLTDYVKVWLGPCGSGPAGNKWLIYPDGSIRPPQRTYDCLDFDNYTSGRVLMALCRLSYTSSRWLFTENSTIWNQRSNLVLDVPRADPSLGWIVVYPPSSNGAVNQKWKIIYD